MPTQDTSASSVDASTVDRVDTWNVPRSSSDLRQFIEARTGRLGQHHDFLLDLDA